MNKIVFIVALTLISIECFAQTYYEKGYFIDNKNNRTDCFIKNSDWKKNPTSFKYKLSENGEVQNADIINVNEFSVPNSFKFIKAEVDIDISPSSLKDLSIDKNPIWEHKQLFLKVLVEGPATLYAYYDSKIDERFFYLCNDSAIHQLVYKEYIYDIDHTAVNDTFRFQLQNNVHCSFESDLTLSELAYNKNDLEKYFITYNTCIDTTYKIPEKKHSKNKFSLAFSTGLAYSSLSMSNYTRAYVKSDFGSKFTKHFTMDIEYIFPFYNNKWGLLLSTAYQSVYHAENFTKTKSILVDFESIDLAFGLKHYLYLNNSAKFYFEGCLNSIWNHSFNSKIGFKMNTTKDFTYLPIGDIYNTNFIIGTGFEYKRIFSGLRYYTKQNILSRYGSWHSDFEKISISIGYKILKTKP